jgi:hypothetical protein
MENAAGSTITVVQGLGFVSFVLQVFLVAALWRIGTLLQGIEARLGVLGTNGKEATKAVHDVEQAVLLGVNKP